MPRQGNAKPICAAPSNRVRRRAASHRRCDRIPPGSRGVEGDSRPYGWRPAPCNAGWACPDRNKAPSLAAGIFGTTPSWRSSWIPPVAGEAATNPSTNSTTGAFRGPSIPNGVLPANPEPFDGLRRSTGVAPRNLRRSSCDRTQDVGSAIAPATGDDRCETGPIRPQNSHSKNRGWRS